MNTLFKDIRYGFQSLLKHPGFTGIAVLTLALGIGANTAIFSVINAVLLRPLPFADPDRLVMVWEDASFAGFPRNTPAPANYVDIKKQNTVFEDVAAQDFRSFNLTGDGEPIKLDAQGVTANFFPLQGVTPVVGRNFTAEEDQPNANKVVLINYGLWQQRYGGDRNIVGKSLQLNGERYRVVGVMPRGYEFLNPQVGLWVPIGFTQEQLAQRDGHYLTLVARMKPGVTVPQASADIHTIMTRIARDYPDDAARLDAYALSLRDQLAGDSRQPLFVLMVAVGFVLLIACANIANLLLSRAATRRKEIAVRTAMGASRFRIMRQLLIESLMLAAAGSIVGLLLALWSFSFLKQLIPDGMAAVSLSLNPRVLIFTFAITALTAIVFGLAPAFQASKVDLNSALKQGGGRSGLNVGGSRLRGALVVAEVALAMVLLVGAGLLIQTFLKLRNQYSSMQPESVLTMRTVLPESRYPNQARRSAFYQQVLERVRTLPGVAAAAYTTSVPLEWKGGTNGFYVEGLTVDQARSSGLSYDANHRQVSADYFRAIGVPIKQGRPFAATDNASGLRVAVVNETMAHQYWPGQSPLNKRFKLGDPEEDIPWITIVGVSGDVRQMGVDEPVKPEMYFPYQQADADFYAPRDLIIRTASDPMSLIESARNEIRQVDPDQPISNIRTMGDVLSKETSSRRLGMMLVTVFAGVALLLASLGIYGVLAYFVAQHTQEIGVRMALGAQQRNILALVLRRGMTLALLGVGIGLFGAFALLRLMSSLLYGIVPSDPLTYASVALLLTAVAFLACYLPARRATRIDPMVALVYE